MGIWAEHFHPNVLLRWEVLGWIIASLLAVAGIVLIFDQFLAANICFALVALFFFAKIISVSLAHKENMTSSLVFSFLLCGLVGAAITATIAGVNRYREKKASEANSEHPHAKEQQENRPLSITAYLAPGYPEGFEVGGIKWKKGYYAYRVSVGGSETIQNLSLEFKGGKDVTFDGIGQLSNLPGFSSKGLRPELRIPMRGQDGRDYTFSTNDATYPPGDAPFAKNWAIFCPSLPKEMPLELLLEVEQSDGSTPYSIPPNSLHITGTYEARGESVPVDQTVVVDVTQR